MGFRNARLFSVCFFADHYNNASILAASIILYAFTQKKRHKNLKSYLLILFASIFHGAALIGFSFILIEKYKINRPLKMLIPLIALIIGYFGYFSKILNAFVFFVPTRYLGHLDRYAYTEPNIGILHLILIVIYIAQYLIEILYKKDTGASATEIDFLEKGQMFYFTFYFITLSSRKRNS